MKTGVLRVKKKTSYILHLLLRRKNMSKCTNHGQLMNTPDSICLDFGRYNKKVNFVRT